MQKFDEAAKCFYEGQLDPKNKELADAFKLVSLSIQAHSFGFLTYCIVFACKTTIQMQNRVACIKKNVSYMLNYYHLFIAEKRLMLECKLKTSFR